jgi:hypothetical protein
MANLINPKLCVTANLYGIFPSTRPFPSSEVDESVPVEWTPDRQKVPLPVSLDYKKQHPQSTTLQNEIRRRESWSHR